METRVAILERENQSIKETLKDILPKIDKHDMACEINIPKVNDSHDAITHLSKIVSDINIKLNAVIQEADRVDEERKQRDSRDQVFKDSTIDSFNAIRRTLSEVKEFIATEKGKDEGEEKGKGSQSFLIGIIVTILLAFNGWLGLNSQSNSVAIADLKAIKKEKQQKEKKKKEDR